MNHSPWIAQLERTRGSHRITQDIETDIVIVGGGIAGVTTAFFILTQTEHRVVLIEADKIAHGATGHNAGQITGYFEIPFAQIVARFGTALAGQAYKAINVEARVLLEHIFSHTQIETPFSQFLAYDGWINHEQVIAEFENMNAEVEAGLVPRKLIIAKEWIDTHDIPMQYRELYEIVPHEHILNVLETVDVRYIAATPFLSGCMNSALFTDQLAVYLVQTFPDRCTVYEHSPVHDVHVLPDSAMLCVLQSIVMCKKVILCTNGFDHFGIYEGEDRQKIDRNYHKNVEGVIGFMGAYLEDASKHPFTASYNGFTKRYSELITDSIDLSEAYFYVTRRPYPRFKDHPFNICTVGGPDRRLPKGDVYDPHMYFPQPIRYILSKFAEEAYGTTKEFDFLWHGLMGYTKTGFRIIGADPISSTLLYNVGCNGVGILPSIYGAQRIVQVIEHQELEPTIFDPQL